MTSMELDKQVEQFLADHQAAILEDIKRLIRVPSVGTTFHPDSPEPFGAECAAVLREAEQLAAREDLSVTAFAGYGIKVQLGDSEEGIGLFAHLDVVPAGRGWSFPPFSPFEKDGFLFGRGAMDNKSAAVLALYVLKFFKETNVRLDHNAYVFLGVNEESGMRDIRYFLSQHQSPSFGIVADAYYPVCYAEKGIVRADVTGSASDDRLLSFQAGEDYNMVPAVAEARLRGLTSYEVQNLRSEGFEVAELEGIAVVRAQGKAGHAAFPAGTQNAARKLAGALLTHELVEDAAARAVLTFLSQALGDPYGEGLGITHRDETGPTTSNAGIVAWNEGTVRIGIDVRYGLSQSADALQEQLAAYSRQHGLSLTEWTDSPPHYMDKDDLIIAALCRLANSELGLSQAPYAMGGATYARWLPRTVAFGPLRTDVQTPFPEGKGSSHQPDEAMRISQIWDAFKIYIKAIVEIDQLLSDQEETG
ncbi:Sapep family Mn(2+)-dependent dipeptidase [Paenibacillus odorifer]|uniref:Sapep family Mn(2+)-dependent dipeptidase n=1 Tax=Paenibacillus odorifer TaxID=189426 RepID=UPI0004F61D78|nr:Sapep family Mn(2+)-dependent dipeptidase [Paenibacillus odorifer]AIQ73042.1 hypothetical protein PODO_07160 [Paenibacillus odorifer]